MTQTIERKDKLFAELDALGAERVAERVAAGGIYRGDKLPLIQLWLTRKAEERNRAAQSRTEWRANLALVIAGMSALASLLALWLS